MIRESTLAFLTLGGLQLNTGPPIRSLAASQPAEVSYLILLDTSSQALQISHLGRVASAYLFS